MHRSALAIVTLLMFTVAGVGEVGAQPPTDVKWTRLGPNGDEPAWPEPNPWHVSVYDSKRHRLVMLFDMDGRAWALDLTTRPPTWAPLETQGESPAGRIWQGGIYDPVGDRLIMQGGEIDWNASDTTWVLTFSNPPRWSVLDAPGEKPPRGSNSASVYDAVGHRMLMYGGNFITEPLSNGMWELALGELPRWRRFPAQGVWPGNVGGATFVHNSQRNQFVLFGGWQPYGVGRQTFIFHPLRGATGEWEWLARFETPPLIVPPHSSNHGAFYDPTWDRVILHGGRGTADRREEELWALELEPEPVWVQLSMPPVRPVKRGFHSMIFDPRAGRALLFGGTDRGVIYHDLWELTWPLPYTIVRIEVLPGRKSPRINPNSGREIPVTVFGSADLAAADIDPASLQLAGAAASTRHAPRYEDVDRDGHTDLTVRFPADEMTLSPDGVVKLLGQTFDAREIRGLDNVPARSRHVAKTTLQARPEPGSDPSTLAIGSARIAGGHVNLSFTCDSSRPVNIDVFDVGGRRLWSEARVVPHAGVQEAHLPVAGGVSGVRFIRVRQGEDVVLRRVAIVR